MLIVEGPAAPWQIGAMRMILLFLGVLACAACTTADSTQIGRNKFRVTYKIGSSDSAEAARTALERGAETRCPGGWELDADRLLPIGPYGTLEWEIHCR